MNEKEIKEASLNLTNNAIIANIGYIDEEGYPAIKAMIILKHEDLDHFWFFTNTNTSKARQLKKNPLSTLYIQDFIEHKGLLLSGTVEIVEDATLKNTLWQDTFKVFFPSGINDPNLTLLRFDTKKGNFYDSVKSHSFAIA